MSMKSDKRYCKINFDFWFVGLFVIINPRPQSYLAYKMRGSGREEEFLIMSLI